MKDTPLQSSSSTIAISNISLNQLIKLSSNPITKTTKWSTKEKLYLISLVMVNGDSNWSYICNEMNKLIETTSSNEDDEIKINNNRTPSECSKQYRFMIKSFVLKYSYCDLKKIYNDLVNQRLIELKNLIIRNRQQYNDLHKEVEQILSMGINNFDELARIWHTLKTNFNTKLESENEEKDLDKNVRLLLYINEQKRKQEEEREKERERLRLVEEERKRKEEEERLKREEEAKELERQRLLKEQLEKEEERKRQQEMLLLEQEKHKQRQAEKDETKRNLDEQQDASNLNIKTESNDVILLSDGEMKESSSKQGDDFKKSLINSSDDEYLSLNEMQKKQAQKDGSIEWKPSVPQAETTNSNSEETSSKTQPSSVSTGRTRRQHSLRLNPTGKQAALLSNRNRLNISESNASSPSASSSSDHDLKNDETANSGDHTSKLTTRSTSKLAAINNKNKSSGKIESTNQNSNEDAELIFTPLIKCDKEEEPTASGDQTNVNSNEHEETSRKSRKSISNIQANKIKNNKIAEETTTVSSSSEQQQTDQQEESQSDQSSNNNRSLRSKLRSNQQSQSQLQAVGISKRKSLVAVNSPAQSSKDQGLVSIIKSEPVQISASSTVSNEEIGEDNVPTTRLKSNQETGLNKFDDEKTYKAWKKSITMVLNNISCHKHATIFMQPVRDEIAPGYSKAIRRPIDLTTVKKNIENGSIKSTREFQRDIMLMFTNAFMYNPSNHDIHKITLEMYREVLNDIEQLLNAQETMGDEIAKPLRFKDIRSSTTSDRGAETESKEDANEIVVNLLMKSKKEANRDDLMETSSIKSSSSISTPLTSNSNSNSVTAKSIKNNKLDNSSIKSSANQAASNKNSRKRRPSVSVSLNESTNNNQSNTSINSNQSSSTSPTQNQPATPGQPKSKRRKSGR